MSYDEIYNEFYNNYTSGGLDGSVIYDATKVNEVKVLINQVVKKLEEQAKNLETKFNFLNNIVDISDLTDKVSIKQENIKSFPNTLLTQIDILIKDIENNAEAIEFYGSLKNHNSRQAFIDSTLKITEDSPNIEGRIKLSNNEWENIKNCMYSPQLLIGNSQYVRSPYIYGTGHQNILFKRFSRANSQFQSAFEGRDKLITGNPRFRNLDLNKIEDPFSDMNKKAAFAKGSLFTAYITKKTLETTTPKEIVNTKSTSNRKTFKRATVITEQPKKVETKPLEELYSPKVDKIEIPKDEVVFKEEIPRLDETIEEVKKDKESIIKKEEPINSSDNNKFSSDKTKENIKNATNKISSTISKSINNNKSSLETSIASLNKKDDLAKSTLVDMPKSKGSLSSLITDLKPKQNSNLINRLVNPNSTSQSSQTSSKVVAPIIAGTVMAGGAGVGAKMYIDSKKEKEIEKKEPEEKIERLNEEIEEPLSQEEILSKLESDYL